MKIPDANILNTEHTWPQSKFSKGLDEAFEKSDLHHLFPTSNKLNSLRGNYPFGEVDESINLFYSTRLGDFESFCKRGKPLAFIGFEELLDSPAIVFQPPSEHQGNIARALFYFRFATLFPFTRLRNFTCENGIWTIQLIILS